MPSKKTPKWRIKEQIAAILESGLAPDARVEFDKQMPRLDGIDEPRQCDAVITSGAYPRELVSIVEVQDRKKKYDIASFDQHLAKMRQVGANHLIVVAVAGFTRSVVDQARREGPRVRLMTLRELEAGIWPVGIHSDFKAFRVTDGRVEGTYLTLPDGGARIPHADLRFATPNEPAQLMDVSALVDATLIAHSAKLFDAGPGTHRLSLLGATTTLGWRLRRAGKLVPFELTLDITVTIELETIPMRAEGYREAESLEAHGWVVSAVSEEEGDSFDFRLILVPDGERGYRVVSLTNGGARRGAIFLVSTPDS